MTTSEFIHKYREEDIRKIAFLCDRNPEIDKPFAMNQIQGWQIARRKLPEWASLEGIIYPPHISMEQCSSEPTALYKSSLLRRLLSSQDMQSMTYVDLTGGFGVDFSYMSRLFGHAIYVEQNLQLCEIAEHNFRILGLNHVEVYNEDSQTVLSSLDHADVIFLDPARRDTNGAKVYGLADCAPDLLNMRDELLDKAKFVVLKLSPMLDIHVAAEQLRYIIEMHVVSVHNDCKELLLVLSKSPIKNVATFCVNDNQTFTFYSDESMGIGDFVTFASPVIGQYLYEPNASIMKVGCFHYLSSRFKLSALSANSHLFLSDELITDFPGRKFRILSVSTFNKKNLRRSMQSVSRANITVRNFPMSAEELRRRLKLRDGGDVYIFATTLSNDQHVLIITKKEL
jgi:16S rRNA G966 N2-methylase RsmD